FRSGQRPVLPGRACEGELERPVDHVDEGQRAGGAGDAARARLAVVGDGHGEAVAVGHGDDVAARAVLAGHVRDGFEAGDLVGLVQREGVVGAGGAGRTEEDIGLHPVGRQPEVLDGEGVRAEGGDEGGLLRGGREGEEDEEQEHGAHRIGGWGAGRRIRRGSYERREDAAVSARRFGRELRWEGLRTCLDFVIERALPYEHTTSSSLHFCPEARYGTVLSLSRFSLYHGSLFMLLFLIPEARGQTLEARTYC